MKKSSLLFVFLLLLGINSKAQDNYLQINEQIILPKSEGDARNLISSLNHFLLSAQKPNEENKFIYEAEKVETFILLDEVNGIEKSSKFNDDHFYKPYLTNIVPLDKTQYLIQVSYIGVNNNIPVLRASFAFIAHQNSNNSFVFSSPLKKNTQNWKTEKAGNNTFYFQHSINKKKVREFNTLASEMDKKLQPKIKDIAYYCTDNLIELQNLIGVQYKSDYNGSKEGSMSATSSQKKVIILGENSANFNDFDTHDLWHDRLSLAIPRSKVYKPVDEACAYLYGGSWGIGWKEILRRFKEKIAQNKNTDWKDLKENPVDFGESEEKHLMADYVVNALLVEKLEKEKGFSAVWELLNCGKWEKGNEKYYQTLEKLTGITKENYNEKVWELVNAIH